VQVSACQLWLQKKSVPVIFEPPCSFVNSRLSVRGEQPHLVPFPPSSAVVKKEYSYTSTSPMGRTACTEPQFLYKGALLITFGKATEHKCAYKVYMYKENWISLLGVKRQGRGVDEPPHLAQRLMKEYSYTYNLHKGLHYLFQGKIYLY